MLTAIANVLASRIKRASDFYAYGEYDEFWVLLPNTERSGAVKVAETLRIMINDLEIENTASEIGKYVTVSLGLSTCLAEQEQTHQDLINKAGQALEIAKKEGRNCTRFIV